MRLFEREMERKKPVLFLLFLLISSALCKGKTYVGVKFCHNSKPLLEAREVNPQLWQEEKHANCDVSFRVSLRSRFSLHK